MIAEKKKEAVRNFWQEQCCAKKHAQVQELLQHKKLVAKTASAGHFQQALSDVKHFDYLTRCQPWVP